MDPLALLAPLTIAELILALTILRPMNAPSTAQIAERPTMPTAPGGELVVRLSDTCSACHDAVPVVNTYMQLAQAGSMELVVVAEIAGDAEAFAATTGLALPVREWRPQPASRAGSVPERLPNASLWGQDGELLRRFETDELESVAEALADGGRARVAEVAEAQRAALAADLGQLSLQLTARGHLNERVDWRVAADTPVDSITAAAQANAVIAVTPRLGRALRDGTVDAVSALMHGEIAVYGDARSAAEVITGLATARYLVLVAEPGGIASPGDHEPACELPRVPPAAFAAEAIALMPPVPRRAALRGLWEQGRTVSEREADNLYAVFELLVLRGCSC